MAQKIVQKDGSAMTSEQEVVGLCGSPTRSTVSFTQAGSRSQATVKFLAQHSVHENINRVIGSVLTELPEKPYEYMVRAQRGHHAYPWL
eukprot:5334648-Prymnesium_polylepis.2